MSIIYLKKANDDVVSHCSCGDGLISFPPQISCPWCGCGWLFTCITCRKGFTFAEGVQIESAWEELAQEDIRNMWRSEATDDEVRAWIATMKEILADVRIGDRYVILDGAVIPITATGVEFDGWHAHHKLESLPQVDALSNRSIIEKQLANREYWIANALPDSG